MAEKRAEHEMLATVQADTISSLLTSGVSVNRFAGNWRQFNQVDDRAAMLLEGLHRVPEAVEKFLGFWGERDKEIHERSMEATLIHDVFVFVSWKAWEFKYMSGFFINEEIGLIAHRWRCVKAFKSAANEAVNHTLKVHGDATKKIASLVDAQERALVAGDIDAATNCVTQIRAALAGIKEVGTLNEERFALFRDDVTNAMSAAFRDATKMSENKGAAA